MKKTCPECWSLLAAPTRQYAPHAKLKFVTNGRSGPWHLGGGRRTEYRCTGCQASLVRSAFQVEPGWKLGSIGLR
jgi:hypothetical protein